MLFGAALMVRKSSESEVSERSKNSHRAIFLLTCAFHSICSDHSKNSRNGRQFEFSPTTNTGCTMSHAEDVPTPISIPCMNAQECIPEWDQNSTTALIQMYKERKCLWDTTHEFYKNRRLRREALTEMANHFGCSLADVEKKLYMLRSSFRKEYKRWNYAKLTAGNNSSFVRKPQWFALDLLMFLKDDMTKKTMNGIVGGEGFENLQAQQSQQSQQQPQPTDLDLNTSEIQNVFYYDSENSTLTPLEPGEVTLDYNLQPIQVPEIKQSPGSSSKRTADSNLLELTNKRQKTREVEDSKIRILKGNPEQEKDSFYAFGNFVAEELKGIKDLGQMQLAKLRIHQILFDATRNFLKVPIPRI